MNSVTVVNFSDSRGGAAIAVRNLVCMLSRIGNNDVKFIVAEKLVNDKLSIGPKKSEFYFHLLLRVVALLISKFQLSKNKSKHSLNIFSSNHVKRYIYQAQGIIHFHWINNETLSILDIIKFVESFPDRKIIFTLHDEWLFCGSEHIGEFNSVRYIEGYNKNNNNNKIIDIDRFIFCLKERLARKTRNHNIIITVPSTYMLNKARNSYLLSDANIALIPNMIETTVFRPCLERKARENYGIGYNKFVILFGAIGGGDFQKGSDLLKGTLRRVRKKVDVTNIQLVTFGGREPSRYILEGFDAIELGHVSSRDEMALVYNSGDLTVVPSRRESFGQVAAESLSCGVPVIAFNNSGIADIVDHGQSGYLANPFDTDMMAGLIVDVIRKPVSDRKKMGHIGRQQIEKKFSECAVSKKWCELYGWNEG